MENNKNTKKKLLIIVGVFLVFILGLFVLGYNPVKITTGFIQGTLIEVQSEYAHVVEDNSVYIDDENVFINITPHTSNNPVIQFRTKNFTGNVDVVFGFNTNMVTPTNAKTSPYWANVTNSYTCDYDFNYTTNPNYAWCYRPKNDTNQTEEIIVFEHTFDTGNIPSKTIYWNELELHWNEIPGAFDYVNYDFLGYNKWYYKKDISVVAGQNYYLTAYLKPTDPWNSNYKYFFGIKPSSETLQEAISNGHFYYIDPWTDDLTDILENYYKMDDNLATTNVIDEYGGNNGTLGGGNNTEDISITGKIETALDFDGSADYVTAVSGITGDTTVSVSMWVKSADCTTGGARNPITVNVDGTGSYNTGFGFGYPNCASDQRYNILIQDVAWGSTSCPVSDDDQWHHVVLIRDGSDYELYFDGNATACATLTNAGGTFSNDIMIGVRYLGGSDYFEGAIDEIALFNSTLNSTQRDSLYNSGDGITYPPEDTSELNMTFPTTSNPANVSADDNVTIKYFVGDGSTNITSGINITNASIEGDDCVINEYCEGTNSSCSTWTNQSYCEHATCTWTPGGAGSTTGLFDDNMDDLNNWSNTNWGLTASPVRTGNSAECAAKTTCTMDMAVTVDTSDADAVNVSFWYYDDDCDAGEVIWYWNDSGGNWDSMGNIDGGTLSGDDNWYAHDLGSRDTQYLHTGFAVRFYANPGNNENYWIEDVLINKSTDGAADTCSGTSRDCNDYNTTTCGDIDTGCSWDDEFYITDHWESKITIPSGKTTALYDLFLDVEDTGTSTDYNNTESNAINYTGAAGDTCTYSSGDWEVDCSDDCSITSPVDVGGNDIIITGTGTFTTDSDIYDFVNLYIEGTDSSNRCIVTCDGGCFVT